MAYVPKGSDESGFECQGALGGNALRADDARLVGPTPLIRVTDGGLTPDASPQRPWVMRSRITLTAVRRQQASMAAVSFHVDKALTGRMMEGDEIHLSRTRCGGLGLSFIRGGALVAAVGAITSVPLGTGIRASLPLDLVSGAEAVFRQRDPDFAFAELPIEVCVDGSQSIILAGKRSIAEYELSVLHGFVLGLPGNDACAALHHRELCNHTVAVASAMLLNDRALSMVRWS